MEMMKLSTQLHSSNVLIVPQSKDQPAISRHICKVSDSLFRQTLAES